MAKRKKKIKIGKDEVIKAEKIKGDIKQILSDIKELNKDIDDTGEDVDDIKEDIQDIKEDIGEDVDELKEHIKDIKEDISALHAKKGFFEKLRTLPEKFESDDFAQQIVGALILSSPFLVTEEVWKLSNNLGVWHLVAVIFITVMFDFLLFKFAKFQNVDLKEIGFMPLRIISLLLVGYGVATIMMLVFGVIGGQVTNLLWAVKLIALVGLFANIGAGTADLIR